MAIARDIIGLVAAWATLLLLFASFIGVNLSQPPHQHESPVTHYPTWHEEYKNENKEITMSFTLLALLFSSTAAYAAHRAVRAPSRSLTGFVTIKDGHESSSTQINTFIKLYIFATWAAVVAYLFVDVGKIWAVVGALHNLLEVALLVVIQSGGRVTSMTFGIYMFIYVCVTIICRLCSDFGLIVMFVRMYISTKKQLALFGGKGAHDAILANDQRAADQQAAANAAAATMGSSASLQTVLLNGTPAAVAPQNPLQHIHSGWKKLVARAPVLGGHSSDSSDSEGEGSTQRAPRRREHTNNTATTTTLTPESTHNSHFTTTVHVPVVPTPAGSPHIVTLNQDTGIWGVQWENPDQIWLLIIASIAHVIGNCVTTIFVTSLYAMAAFHISYGIAYPLYAYYLYVDNHALRQTKIYLPDFSKVKTATYVAVALIGATATIRAGLFVATQGKEGANF
ncbi:hypothetical protein BG006_009396 [Podila minutissima]|uniref:Uncharacterized protein n=1 Tax=Podila minutissima TaxID=64525 RepID=A0A9P5SEL5_9FUNG|nr:hypothetical protein BG006_009396 [Podila minutissima]